MSDLFGNHIVGFPTRRLKYNADCIDTNSCCRGEASESDILSGRVCKSSMVKKREGLKSDRDFHDGFVDGINSYFITDRCPAHERDADIRENCNGIKKSTLNDYIWVSDTLTGKIFQNHHCARCHDIKEWKTWNIKTQCNSVNETSFLNITATLYSDNCNIINIAPDDIAGWSDSDRCFIPTIWYCNQTGNFKIQNDFLHRGCNFNMISDFLKENSNVVPGYLTEKIIIDTSKLINCYGCSDGDVRSTKILCLARLTRKDRSPCIGFSALIDYRGAQKDQGRSSVCALDQIYDAYMVSKIKSLFIYFW